MKQDPDSAARLAASLRAPETQRPDRPPLRPLTVVFGAGDAARAALERAVGRGAIGVLCVPPGDPLEQRPEAAPLPVALYTALFADEIVEV